MKKVGFVLLCAVLIVLSLSVGFYVGIDTNGVLSIESEKQNEIKIPSKMIAVPLISQHPALPTGCESVAATMVLQYYGADMTPDEFVTSWLECSARFYKKKGKLYGPDPHKVFAGNPFTSRSYGCFALPIVNAINRNSSLCKAEKITDKPLPDLCREYIDNNKPLLIWATMGMRKSYKGQSWYLEDGSKFTWIAGEHCLVLVGYNEDHYFLNDPISGSVVAYEKSIVEKRFAELGHQVVYIFPKSSTDF